MSEEGRDRPFLIVPEGAILERLCGFFGQKTVSKRVPRYRVGQNKGLYGLLSATCSMSDNIG